MERDEIRCPSRIVGKIADGRLEVKCRSEGCGARKGIVVMHYFDLLTGDLIETRKFQGPEKLFNSKKEASAPCR